MKIYFSADHQFLVAEVKETKLYEVYFYGLLLGIISSSCTCLNDWANVCEHEVAVANEIDSAMTVLSASEISLLSKKVKPK
jgi:uncharacterized Zn finger protein|tara:strand:+ start:8371 stop:8613 length:243 start_codon:yes stop_codon:yes gene_type:complete